MSNIEHIALHEAARYRYLNYAMSVITSRALPDVRDGLKPVQRRILYGMYHNLKLYPEGRFRKSAAVVGEVMAKYHPHGDSSIYDAMVRMAQPFSLRHPLIEGQGNFGSLDGDNAAAMRYTEAKLRPIAIELLSELKQKTVEYRPNYDGQQFEPIVLPAQLPNILINGSEGIAVGMATKILPHNLRESVDACVALIDNPDLTNYDLCKKVKAPDFPTGGTILNSNTELKEIYATGQGGVRLRGNWELEKDARKYNVVITEIPYSVNKANLVEKIGSLISSRKVPQLVDVRDESTDEVRIVVVLKVPSGSSPEREMNLAMAYLCKHTQLQITLSMNMTCLVPTENPEIAHPIKATLKELLRHWLKFRFSTIERRFQYELLKLRERIHLLEGFANAFEILDELIALIRASDGRRDAHEKIIERFNFDDEQTEAILDLKLYKLAKLEIWAIQEELSEKRKEAEDISEILSSQTNIWSVVRSELLELRKLYGDKRRTKIGGEEALVEISDAAAYIIDEQTCVIVTKEGWIKRQGSYSDISKIRLREGDSILGISKASTKSTIGFFTNLGISYVMRIADIPSTTGYGEPLQKHFSFSDGERLCGVFVYDEKTLPTIDPEEGPHSPFLKKLRPDKKPSSEKTNLTTIVEQLNTPDGNTKNKENQEIQENPKNQESIVITNNEIPSSGLVPTSPLNTSIIEDPENPPPYGVALTKKGRCVRFSILKYRELTNKTGRRYMRLDGSDDAVVAAYLAHPHDWVALHTIQRILSFPISDIPLVKGSGKGVYAIKLDQKDPKQREEVVAFILSRNLNEGIQTQTSRGKDLLISPKSACGRRGSKGKQVIKRGRLEEWTLPLIRHHKIWVNTNIQNNSSTEESTSSIIKVSKGNIQVDSVDTKSKKTVSEKILQEAKSKVKESKTKETKTKETKTKETKTKETKTKETKTIAIQNPVDSSKRTSPKREIPIILSQPNSALINKYQQKTASSSINELPKTNSSKQDSSEDDISIETYTSDQIGLCVEAIPTKDISSPPKSPPQKKSHSTKKSNSTKKQTAVRAGKVSSTSQAKLAQKTNIQKETTKNSKTKNSKTKNSKTNKPSSKTIPIPGLFDSNT